MGLGAKFRYWKFSKFRLEAFSDAVFAIIITLLVLEIKVPHIEQPHNTNVMWQALWHLLPKIWSWVISFIFVGIMWLHHHNILRMATQADYGMIWINLLFLMAASFVPFPTAFAGEYPHQPMPLFLLCSAMSFTTLLFVWLYWYVAKFYLSDKYDPAKMMHNVRKSLLAGPLMYAIAAGITWFSVTIAYFIVFFVPILYILPLDKEKEEVLTTQIVEED
jgi:uncharacterized membrane protein